MANLENKSYQTPFQKTCPIGSQLISLVEAHSTTISDKLKTIGLYKGQEMILKLLKDNEDCSQKELTEKLCLDHSTIAISLARMEKAGYVSRRKSEKDRRKTLVSLTEKGKQTINKAETIWIDTESILKTNLSSAEEAEFMRLASIIVGNLTK